MGHDKPVATLASHSAVESIVGALAELEIDIDSINARMDEMKKRLLAHSNEEVDKLKQQIISMANEEARRIVEAAKAEAETDSAQIMKEAETNLTKIKLNIDASFDKAVENIVKTVLEQERDEKSKEVAVAARQDAPTTSKPKIKKYGSDGKPVN